MATARENTLKDNTLQASKNTVKVSGFTIVRNVITYDYPVVESILSILPLCDEFIVSVGRSEDDTRKLISMISTDNMKILDSIWDDNLREGGKVLAIETNKAFAAVAPDSDWAFYLQADEVIHENDLPAIKAAMLKYKDDPEVEGLLFKYKHFYGSFDYIGTARQWYRKEIRVIKNDKSISSYRDAQGFRKNGEKLKVKEIDATVYHYGWVKPPAAQQAKQRSFHRMWHDDEWMKKNVPPVQEFDYSKIDALEHFKGKHPGLMNSRIETSNWKFSFDPTKKQLSFLQRALMFIERRTGWRIGEYKNYKIC